MRAQCMLRPAVAYRRDLVIRGLKAAGYEVLDTIAKPKRQDVVVIWNRYGAWHQEALRFEGYGGRAVVIENGYLGKDWQGDNWLAMSCHQHAGRGWWPHRDEVHSAPGRWDEIGAALAPWRAPGGEVVVLHQRGIGAPTVKSPSGWAEQVSGRIRGSRVRVHPGAGNTVDMETDLRRASAVLTWASSAALRCLAMGIPVWYDMHGWIGAPAARPLEEWGHPGRCDDEARLRMFRRLAWAQWRLKEIEDGSAFRALLGS